MKYIVIVLFSIFCFSQVEEPVSWSYEVEQSDPDNYNLKIIAKIDDGWHIYSQYKDPDSFIRETSFYFESNNNINFIPFNFKRKDNNLIKVFFKEEEPIKKYLEIQDEVARYFENEAVFTQQISLNKTINEIQGKLEFMVCNDVQCLPPQIINIVFFLNSD